MNRQLARNLYHLMRGAARRTTVDRLKRTGHRTVSVLSFREIQGLVEQSIDNSLRRRGIAMDGPDVREEIRLEFLALLQERDSLQASVETLLAEKEELARNRDHLSQAIAATAEQVRDAQEAAPETRAAADLDDLRATVEARLRELLAGQIGGEAALGEKVVSLVVQAIDEQREAALARAQVDHEQHLTTLQRRLHRLKAKLAETEEMLWRARAEGGVEGLPGEPVDPGLKLGDPKFDTKKQLLGEIFRLNVELRAMLKAK